MEHYRGLGVAQRVLLPVVRPATTVVVPAADRDAIREALTSRDDVAVAGFFTDGRRAPVLRSYGFGGG